MNDNSNVTLQECITPPEIFADLIQTDGIVAQDLVVDDPVKLNELKELLSTLYGIPVADMTFDRVEFYTLDASILGEEFNGLVWVVLFQEGCFLGSFTDSVDTYVKIKDLVKDENL
jgi:hypothetical protein